jgi:endonuclease/exonuclease/phosphatase family metal-dependent hydrolase
MAGAVIKAAPPSQPPLRILLYNVMLRPRRMFPDGQLARVKEIAARVHRQQAEFDVIVFCELFDQQAHAYLGDFLQRETAFRYATPRVGTEATTNPGVTAATAAAAASVAGGSGWRGIFSRVASYASFVPALLNGGVQVFSRFPLDQVETRVFCHRVELKGSDRLAKKGFVYARVALEGSRRVHVVATHLQAWEDRKAVDMRLKEAAHIRRFLRERSIPADEPILIVGDLNVDSIHAPGDLEDISHVLHACLLDSSSSQTPSMDAAQNDMVGRDGAKPDKTTGRFRPERLDHCLVVDADQRGSPVDVAQSRATVFTDWVSGEELTMGIPGLRWTPWKRLRAVHLSDHFPVLFRVAFR